MRWTAKLQIEMLTEQSELRYLTWDETYQKEFRQQRSHSLSVGVEIT